jgi:hypothetical protein
MAIESAKAWRAGRHAPDNARRDTAACVGLPPVMRRYGEIDGNGCPPIGAP